MISKVEIDKMAAEIAESLAREIYLKMLILKGIEEINEGTLPASELKENN